MASLTPGTLQKLLQNVGNKDFKVAGEHRSALLQVISIVPSLEDDPWKSRGYFLRVSDSLHSAYVSVSDADVELILSDKIQLGQFIHVVGFDPGSPVPVLRTVKPVPNRRPCVGDPKDLISSDFLNAKKAEANGKPNGKVKKLEGNRDGNARRLSLGNGKIGEVESRRLSLDSARKGWDKSPISKRGGKGANSKLKDNSPRSVVASTKACPQDSPKGSSISLSPLKSKNVIVSPKNLIKERIMKSSKLPDDGNFPSHFNKVALSSRKLPDSRILWNSLPSTICDLGKEVRSYKNAQIVSAIHALEEASISEAVLQCMRMFAELCESSQKDSSGPLVERFLNLHGSISKAVMIIHNLINAKTSGTNDHGDLRIRNASLWVQAAVQTDLSNFSLYTKGGEKGITNSEKCHYIILETTSEKIDRENHSPKNKKSPTNNNAVPKVQELSKRRISNVKGTKAGEQTTWSEGSGLRHVSKLAEKLLSSSRSWFLDYLEDSLKTGFLRSGEDSVLLRQLKRVNQWLDEAFDDADERIVGLRKKLYGFLLDRVDSAVSCR